jgi:two-component sensor histidine kinase
VLFFHLGICSEKAASRKVKLSLRGVEMERRALRDAASSWTTLDDEGLLLQEITHRVKNEFA